MTGYKKCYGCQTMVSLNKFGLHNNTPDKRQHYCKGCQAHYRRVNSKKNIRYQRERRKKNVAVVNQYGISLKEYEAMHIKQDYRCAICEKHRDDTYRGKLYIDHCHATEKIRGLLCQHCNTMLGFASDDRGVLLRAIKYLK